MNRATANVPAPMVTRPAPGPGPGMLPPPEISAAISSGTAAKSMVSAVATRNLVTMTDVRRTGVASRWTMLPSSISAPSTLVPMISAVSGISTEKPNVPRTCDGHGSIGGREAFSATVSRIRTTAGNANSSARLRLSVARRVIDATVVLNMSLLSWLSWLGCLVGYEVGEDAFQGFIGGQHLAQPDAVVAGQHRDVPAERAVVRGPHLQAGPGQLHGCHRGPADQRAPDQAVVGGTHREHVRPARHQPPDGAEVAGGGQAARHHHLDGAGQPLDLFQDVRAEQDRPALGAELVEQVHHVQALPRVHPVERLVEQQHLRVVHQRRGHLDPLAHALG